MRPVTKRLMGLLSWLMSGLLRRLKRGPDEELLAVRRAGWLATVLVTVLAGCGPAAVDDAAPSAPSATVPSTLEASAIEPWLVAVGPDSGFDFVHFAGRTGELHFAEMMGPGGALLDVDGDGDLDLFLLQGRPLGPGGAAVAQATEEVPVHRPPFSHRLYRNDSPVGAAPDELRFVDVTDTALPPMVSKSVGEAGDDGGWGSLDIPYGMGVAAGDVDGDGAVDLYLTAYGPNQLWRNRGDGTFEDITAAAGVEEERWSVPASFFDYDGDGDLDLWVGNYLDLTEGNRKPCYSETGALDYCGPAAYNGEGDRLWRNRGDGTFEDVTAAAGLVAGGAAARGPALGSATADFDGDGWVDLYVANDGEPNFLWRNRGDGTFEDLALLGGSAVSAEGLAEASMGVVVADFDSNGAADLFLTHLQRETHTLYLNQGDGLFLDVTRRLGLGAASLNSTGFGAVALDANGDGQLDLAVLNGAVKRLPEQMRQGEAHPLRQRAQLFVGQPGQPGQPGQGGQPGGGFQEASERVPAFATAQVGRGLAAGDVDGDGDTDLLAIYNGGPAQLLINVGADGRRWIGARARLATGLDAQGAWVGREDPATAAVTAWRRAARDGSYASASDPRVRFFLSEPPDLGTPDAATEVASGPSILVETLRVRWPDGTQERFPKLVPGAYHDLVQGQGQGQGTP